MRFAKSLAPDWRTIVSAILITLSLAPFGLPLAWIALIPWFAALESTKNLRQALLQGLWLSFFYTLGVEHWVAYALHVYGGLPWAAAIAELVLYSLIGQSQFILTALAFQRIKGLKSFWDVLGFAFLYAGLDALVPKLYFTTVGLAFWDSAEIRQLASVGGTAILAFVAVFVNCALWQTYAWLRRKSGPSSNLQTDLSPVLSIAAAVVLCALAYVYGLIRNQTLEARALATSRHAQIKVIQGNIDNDLRMAGEYQEPGALGKILARYIELTDKAHAEKKNRPTDFYVWPESAYPSRYSHPESEEQRSQDERLEKYAASLDAPLIFGAPDFENLKQFNASFFFDKAAPLRVHRKSKLVPFGEYIPFTESFPRLQSALPVVNLGWGPGVEVFDLNGIKIAPVICYEALFPEFTREAAAKNAQLILNLTNDSWFGPTTEPDLHLSTVIFRSIESGLPQIRATNTGISALILPSGEILQRTKTDETSIMSLDVPISPPPSTLFSKWGNWFAKLSALFGIVLLATRLKRSRTSRPSAADLLGNSTEHR